MTPRGEGEVSTFSRVMAWLIMGVGLALFVAGAMTSWWYGGSAVVSGLGLICFGWFILGDP